MPKSTTPSAPAEFSKVWRRSFGETPPLGHLLRRDFFANWARFHALPESKRYAENDDEWGTIFFRSNALATECFGDRARIWVATGCFNGLTPQGSDVAARMNMSNAMAWVDYREEPEDQSEITVFAALFEWKPNSLDGLFGAIARDQLRAILLSEDAQTVLAPYDGGFDIVSLQPGKIHALEAKYAAWMSSRPDRL